MADFIELHSVGVYEDNLGEGELWTRMLVNVAYIVDVLDIGDGTCKVILAGDEGIRLPAESYESVRAMLRARG